MLKVVEGEYLQRLVDRMASIDTRPENLEGYERLWKELQLYRLAFRRQSILEQASQQFGLQCPSKSSYALGCDSNIETANKLLEVEANIQERLNEARKEYFHLLLEQHVSVTRLYSLAINGPTPIEIEYIRALLKALTAKLTTLKSNETLFNLLNDLSIDLHTNKLKDMIEVKKNQLNGLLEKKDEFQRLADRYVAINKLLDEAKGDCERF